MTKITQNVFSDHSGIKKKNSNKKIRKNLPRNEKNRFINNSCIKEEIKLKIKIF